MNLNKILAMLRNHPMFWSKLGFVIDPVQFDDNSQPVLIYDDIEYLSQTHDQIYDENVKIFTTLLPSGWIGDGKYDYTLVDETLDEVLGDKSDAYYLPRIRLNVPIDWCAAHPEDVFVYEKGPRDAEEIRALVGTDKHDYYGYETPEPRSIAGMKYGKRPNMDGVIGLQSFTSERWLADAGEALRRVVAHVESSKYADQIIGYQIAFGVFGENVWWGCFDGHNLNFGWRKSRRLGDYSINAQRAFWAWGLKKYKTESALREIWGDAVTETDCVPDVTHRLEETQDIKAFLRGYPEDRVCIDYEEFLSDVLTDAICHFAGTVKSRVPDKAVGAFYGYIVGIGNSSYSGHTMADKLLESECIDFLCAPNGYYRSNVTGPGLEQAPTQSFSRRKLWLDEHDHRTHISGHTDAGASETMAETKKILWRESLKSIVFNQGFWWRDMSVGNFDDPEILKEISKICTLNKRMRGAPQTKFRREVLLVVDDAVMRHMKLSYGVSNFMIKRVASDVKMCGVPVDMYRLRDLPELDLSSYKVAVFLNTFEIDDCMKDVIESKFLKKTVFIWNWCAGIINGDVDFRHTKELTGFDLAPIAVSEEEMERYSDRIRVDFPTVCIKNECKSWRDYENGDCMIGELKHNDRVNIMCTLPLLTVDELYRIIERKVKLMYAPKNTCVYADSRIMGVFSCGEARGEIRVGKRARDVINGHTVYGNVEVDMEVDDFAVYLLF